MKQFPTILLASCSLLTFGLCAAFAQSDAAAPSATPAAPPSAPAKLSAAELEKLAMPIALHPDPLIAVLLPASVYPVEIVQAARFVKDTNNIPKVDTQAWDDNVKAVARFPTLIAQMDADLPWTVALGQAFLDQPKELMDTIQALRTKAQKAGTLQNTEQQIITVTNMVTEKIVEQQTVVVTNTIVQIQPSNPEVVYVPSYPPTAYYPPPGYVYSPYAPLVTFGLGMAAGAIIANNWNHCDWHGGSVNVNNVNVNRNSNINANRNNTVNARSGSQQKWQPDQSRMRSSGATSARSADARGYSGGAQARQASQRSAGGGAGAGGARASQQPAGGRSPGASASTQPARSAGGPQGFSGSQRSPSSAAASRPSASPSVSNRGGSSASAFSGVGSGSSARSSSSRGSSSMGGGARSGGGGRGGGGRSGGGGRR